MMFSPFRRSVTVGGALAIIAVLVLTGCASSSNSKSAASSGAVLSSAVVAASAASSGVDSAARALLPAAIQSKGSIAVASSVGFAPYEYYDTDGTTIVGIDADFMKALGPVLGVTFAITDIRYPTIVPALQAKRADVGWSAFGENPDAGKVVDWVTYLSGAANDVIVAATNTSAKAQDDLCGLSIGQVGGEPADTLTAISAKCTADGKKALNIKMFQKTADIVLALQSGQVDARITGSANGAYIVKNSAGKLRLAKGIIENAPVSSTGIIALKGNDALMKALAAGMQDLIKNGQYAKILAKWDIADNGVASITTSLTG